MITTTSTSSSVTRLVNDIKRQMTSLTDSINRGFSERGTVAEQMRLARNRLLQTRQDTNSRYTASLKALNIDLRHYQSQVSRWAFRARDPNRTEYQRNQWAKKIEEAKERVKFAQEAIRELNRVNQAAKREIDSHVASELSKFQTRLERSRMTPAELAAREAAENAQAGGQSQADYINQLTAQGYSPNEIASIVASGKPPQGPPAGWGANLTDRQKKFLEDNGYDPETGEKIEAPRDDRASERDQENADIQDQIEKAVEIAQNAPDPEIEDDPDDPNTLPDDPDTPPDDPTTVEPADPGSENWLKKMFPGLDTSNLPNSELRPLSETAFGAIKNANNLGAMSPFLANTLQRRGQAAIPQFQLGAALGQFGQIGIANDRVELGGKGLQDLMSNAALANSRGAPTSDSYTDFISAAQQGLGQDNGQSASIMAALGIGANDSAQEAFGAVNSNFIQPRLNLLPAGIRGIFQAGTSTEIENLLGGRGSAEVNPADFLKKLLDRGLVR